MKMNIEIQSFGPIKDVNMQIKDINILIGEQACGKSTISKLIYYFLDLRDEVNNFIFECFENPIKDIKKRNRKFDKMLKSHFLALFGPGIYEEALKIKFTYKDNFYICITREKNNSKYLKFDFPLKVLKQINKIIDENINKFTHEYSQVKLFSNKIDKHSRIEINKLQKEIRHVLIEIFSFSEDLLFIPSGRSILSILSEQLSNIHPHKLDVTMRTFINKINSTNGLFKKKMSDLIIDKQKIEGQDWNYKISNIRKKCEKIIKGSYYVDEEGGKIKLEDGKYVKINYSSSGQQESVWIVLSIFLILLDKVKAIVFIEEPEAHLFPIGQKDITELILLTYFYENTNFFITTHSPYILTTLNNALYSHQLGEKGRSIYELQIDANKLTTNKVRNGSITDIIDKETNLVCAEEIDNCSSDICEIFDKLEGVEFSNA